MTADKIRKLSIYYGRAIRGSKKAEDMKKAILASLYHNYSTDDFPQHQYCPPGPTSWCFYKRDVAEHKYPGGHSKRMKTFLDFERLHKHIWPVYERLSDIKLLQRCEMSATQNSNENLHHAIWSRCAKTNFHSKPRVELAAITAITEFNFGPSFARQFLRTVSGVHTNKLCLNREKKRMNRSTQYFSSKENLRRQKKKLAQVKAEAEYVQQHGTVGYGAGQF